MPLIRGREKPGTLRSEPEQSAPVVNGSGVRPVVAAPALPSKLIAPATLLAKPSISGLLLALRRRLLLAVPIALICAGLAGIAAWRWAPTSKSTVRATVQIDADPEAILGSAGGGSFSATQFSNYQKTQISLLKSQGVLAGALADPTIASLSVVRGESSPTVWLSESLEVDFKQGPEILRVSLQGNQPDELALVVNAVIRAYLESCRHSEEARRQYRASQLTELRKESEHALQEQRQALGNLASTLGSADPVKSAGLHELKLKQLDAANDELWRCQSERQQLERRLKVQQAQVESGPLVVAAAAIETEVNGDKVVKQLQEDISRHESVINAVKANARTPAIAEELLRQRGTLDALASDQAALAARLSELRAAVTARLRAAALAQLQQEIAQAKDKLAEFTEREAKLVQLTGTLTRETQASAQELFKMNQAVRNVADQEKSLKVIEDDLHVLDVRRLAPPRSRVLDEAVVMPPKASKVQLAVTGAAIFSVFGATLLLAGFWEFQQRRIDRLDEVIHGFGVDLVGALPSVPRAERATSASLGNDGATPSFLGNLRTSASGRQRLASMSTFVGLLLRGKTWERAGVMMVTSAHPREGETTVASHIAASLALSGRRTLLLDSIAAACQLWLSLNNDPSRDRPAGSFGRSVQAGPLPNLWLPKQDCDGTANGRGAIEDRSNPDAALAMCDMSIVADLGNLFDLLKQSFDVIVLGAGCVLSSPETLVMAPQADGVVFAIRRGHSRMPDVAAALQQLRQLGSTVLGAVLVGSDEKAYSSSYQLPMPAAG